MNDNLKVSVLLPVHNGMPFLPDTVESILCQSLSDFELIVLDDGSTDDGSSYLRSLSDDRVRYHRLERVGLVGALNEGLSQSRSAIIARIDADDIASPTRLEEQYQFLKANPKCVLLGCDYWVIDVQGNIVSENPYRIASDIALRFHLCFTATFSHPGVMFRRRETLEAGGYRPKFDVSEDYDLFTRLALRGEIGCIPKKLLRKRVHADAVSVVHRERGIKQSSVIARDYVLDMFPEFEGQSHGELYLLFQGRPPENSTPAQALNAFMYLQNLFFERYGPFSEEIVQTIHDVRHSLGWQCLQQARSSRSDIKKSLAWYVAAHRFDPLEVSIRGAIRRRARSMGLRLADMVRKLGSDLAER